MHCNLERPTADSDWQIHKNPNTLSLSTQMRSGSGAVGRDTLAKKKRTDSAFKERHQNRDPLFKKRGKS